MTGVTRVRRMLAAIILVNALMWCLLQAVVAAESPSALNISIAVFDPGVPADRSLHRDLQVFPRIREIEALFLPFVLRETLAATSNWGAVRVVPEPDNAAELLISGTIVRSDGVTLELQLRAVDASGRVWLDKQYTGAAPRGYEQSDAGSGLSGYQQLYDQIAADLLLARTGLDDKALADIVEISLLRYASQLAPTAFEDYLHTASDGTFTLNRLPAENDPMLERIHRIRGVEYVMTDAIDAKFQELHAEIASTYDLWREYRREYAQYQNQEAKRLQNSRTDAPRGSFEAMQSRYENYKWDRLAAQEQEKWALGFDNEVSPTVTKMESRVAELDGWVEQNYEEWQRLLAEIFSLETSLTE